jgi:hypothetical protein
LPLPKGRRVAVGFAESPTDASGLVIEVESFQVKHLFTQSSKEPLSGVVPITDSSKLHFVFDIDSDSLHFPRTVNANPSFRLGLTDAGVVRLAGSQPPEVIWPHTAREPTTEIRLAALGALHALTFRRGGQAGSVRFGWLKSDGRKHSELMQISPDSGLSGTPVIAQNGNAALVAYAWRPNTDVYWSIQLALAEPRGTPGRPTPFPIPPGGPGFEAISPAATGLPGGRWLLQWTEGSAGARQVRAQVLGADLSPIGSAVTLSTPDQNAGQGALASQAEFALSLFLVSKGRGHELWGAPLKCP